MMEGGELYSLPFWNEEGYRVYNYEETDEVIYIYIESQRTFDCCFKCGVKSNRHHTMYSREIQDTPIHNKQVFLRVTTYKYYCDNNDCDCRNFTEEIPYSGRYQIRTYALNALIYGVSLFLSSKAASDVLSLLGVDVSHDTIGRMYNRLVFEDNLDVEAVGIDDVATRKGHTYATAIYDMQTHQLIALLEGRDGEPLKEWLKQHDKIKVVARDRASAYASAINDVLPDCVQVADRFHLIQNIIDRLKDIFKEEMPTAVFIKNGEILDKEPKKISVIKKVDEEILKSLDYDNSEPVDDEGNLIEYDNKKRDLSSPQYKRNADSRKEKQALIRKIQERWKTMEKKNISVIVKEYGIAQLTAKKYINMTEAEIIELDQPTNYKKRKTVMDEYINIIYRMIRDNIDVIIICNYIIYKGYTGSINTIFDYIKLISKNNFPDSADRYRDGWYKCQKNVYPSDIIVIRRNELLKYILTKDPKKKKSGVVVNQYFELIKVSYPIVAEVQAMYDDFHSTIMGDDTKALDKFLETYSGSKINGLCEGIKKDIVPVKNAISSNISSGFVEGNNNKFKVIKRILYGRADLVNLSKKCFAIFSSKTRNIDLLSWAKQS